MIGVIGIVTMLTVLGLSVLVTRLATTALTLTGMSEEAARFQARSAFTGTGFTTSEAERVVDHPVRRRIVTVLMLLRSAGLLSIIMSTILSFVGDDSAGDKLVRLGYLAGGAALLWLIARSRTIERAMSRVMERGLRRWTDLDVRDYASLLRLSGPYTVLKLRVREDDWVAERELQSCRLREEGVLVLGIYRGDGSYLGAPARDTVIEAGDTLVLYGRQEPLRELDQRRADPSGEAAHAAAVDEQRREQARQGADDRRRRRSSDDDDNQHRDKQNQVRRSEESQGRS